MKSVKRFLSLLLAMCMMLAMAPVTVLAAQSGTCGENLTWTLEDDGTLTISGTGAMDNYARGDAPWAGAEHPIRYVNVGEGVTTVGEYAFADLTDLLKITLPSTVTQIGVGFSVGCANLQQYVFSSNNPLFYTDGKSICRTIGDYWGCYDEIVAVLPSISGSYDIFNTRRIGDCAFEGATGLTELTLHTGDGSGGAFDFDESKFGTATVMDEIGVRALAGCTGLTTLTIPDGIERIESQAFAGCTGLKTIYFVGDAPEIAADAFEGVTATICYVPENTTWTESVQQNYGGSLTWKPERTTSGTVEDGIFWKFDEATGTLTIYGTGQMTYMEYRLVPWYSCFSLIKNIVIEDGVTGIASNAFRGCTTVESVTMADSVKWVSYYAFEGCSNLKDLTLSQGLIDIGSDAFSGCHSLTSVDLPASISYFSPFPFSNCDNLTAFHVSPDNAALTSVDGVVFSKDMKTIRLVPSGIEGDYIIPESVENFGDMGIFSGCKKLTGITIPEGVTNFGGYSAFSGCTSLTTVNLPETLEQIDGYAFYKCTALETITIPASVNSIGNMAFGNCASLKNVTFEGDSPAITAHTEYVTGAFTGVTATVYVPASNETWTDEIMSADYGGDLTWRPWGATLGKIIWYIDHAGVLNIMGTNGNSAYTRSNLEICFMDDYASPEEAPWYPYREQITAVVIGDTVSNIGSNAFGGCENLTEVTIGEGVVSIGEGAFADCTAIETVTFKGNAPEMGKDIFADTEITVNYPAGNETWTEEVRESCGGNVSWEEYSPFASGDLNGDGEVNDADVAQLLWYTLFGDLYEIQGNADFTGDGEVNDADVAYLLWSTLFPDTYPLS